MKRKYAEGGETETPSRFKKLLSDVKENPLGAVGKEAKKFKQGIDILRGKKPENPDDIPPRNLQDALDEIKRKKEEAAPTTKTEMGKIFKKGGKVGSASKRADGIAQRGKTRGRMM